MSAVNGRFVDPMRISLPRGRVLKGPVLAGFEKERERVEGMMTRKPGVPFISTAAGSACRADACSRTPSSRRPRRRDADRQPRRGARAAVVDRLAISS